MLKPTETCLRFKQIEKKDEKYILRKMSLKFQNIKCDISCKIPFYIFLL